LPARPPPPAEIYKVEFNAQPYCFGSVAYVTINGARQAAAFQQRPYNSLKINRINVQNDEAPFTELCVALRPNSPCTTMEQMCGGQLCTYAVFDTPHHNEHKCCPVRSWADASPR
jgi:hypothetical protein